MVRGARCIYSPVAVVRPEEPRPTDPVRRDSRKSRVTCDRLTTDVSSQCYQTRSFDRDPDSESRCEQAAEELEKEEIPMSDIDQIAPIQCHSIQGCSLNQRHGEWNVQPT